MTGECEKCWVRGGDPKVVLVLVVVLVLDRAFSVPEGLADRSLAIYCQESRQKRIRPGGNGMTRSENMSIVLQNRYRNTVATLVEERNHTVP